MTDVILGLGSNRKYEGLSCIEILGRAVHALSGVLSDISYSSVYMTRAMYVEDQDDFHNLVLKGKLADGKSCRWLLEKIHEIEAQLGRDRAKEIRFGPRSADIDIEFFGDQVIREEDLEVPHPRVKERAFVLVPLLEILPESADDNIRKSVSDALNQISDWEKEIQLLLPAIEFSKYIRGGA